MTAACVAQDAPARACAAALTPAQRRETRACVALTLAAYGLFVLIRLALHGLDPALFVLAGADFTDPAQTPPSLTLRSDGGYDGQFYYRLALNPFDTAEWAHGIRLDSPVYRAQRMLYPLLVHACSWGRPQLAAWMMIAVNWAALGLLAWIAARYAIALGAAPRWGLMLAFYPGLLLSLARDTTEIVAITLLLGGLLALRRNRAALAVSLLTLAVLARETALLACVGLALAWGWRLIVSFADRSTPARRGEWRRLFSVSGWAVWLVPGLIYLAWVAWVSAHWQAAPFHNTAHNFGPPLLAFARLLGTLFPPANAYAGLQLAELGYLIIFFGAVVCSLRGSSARLAERYAFALYALLALCASAAIWTEDWSFLRVLTELHAFGAMILIGKPGRTRLAVAFLMAAFWIALMLHRSQLHVWLLRGSVEM